MIACLANGEPVVALTMLAACRSHQTTTVFSTTIFCSLHPGGASSSLLSPDARLPPAQVVVRFRRVVVASIQGLHTLVGNGLG